MLKLEYLHYFRERIGIPIFAQLLFTLLLACSLSVQADSYQVTIKTADVANAGTDRGSKIHMTLRGKKGSFTIYGFDGVGGDFDRGDLRTYPHGGMNSSDFIQSDIGDIYELYINYTSDDGWYCDWIEVINHTTNKKSMFRGPNNVALAYSSSSVTKYDGPIGGFENGRGHADSPATSWVQSRTLQQHPPVASSLSITGSTSLGATLKATYAVSDKDGDQIAYQDHILKWKRNNGTVIKTDYQNSTTIGSYYTLQAADGGQNIYFEITPKSRDGNTTGSPTSKSISIPRYSQTVTFSSLPDKFYGSSNSFTVGATASSGLTPTYTASGQCTVSGDTVSLTGAGSCTITAQQTGNGNYLASNSVSQSFDIHKGDAVITFPAKTSATYGDAAFTYAPTGSSSAPVIVQVSPADVCTYANGKITVGNTGTCNIAANQAGDVNFNAAPEATTSILVVKKAQTIALNDENDKAYEDNNFTVVATGGGSGNSVSLSSETTNICTTDGQDNSSVVTIVQTGTCRITGNQAGNSNYENASPTSFSINIIPSPQTITNFTTPATKVYGDEPFTVSADVSGSGNPPVFSTSTPTICSVTNDTVTILNAGDCIVKANQASTINYDAAPELSETIQIDPKPITAQTDNKTKTYGTSNPIFTVTYDGLAYDDTGMTTPPKLSTTADINSLTGTYPISCALGISSDDNYTLTSCAAGSLEVTQAQTSVTFVSNTPEPSPPPQKVKFTVKVTSITGNAVPTGTVSVSDGTVSCDITLTNTDSGQGFCEFDFSHVGVGTHAVTAAYAGDTQYTETTSNAIQHTVKDTGILITESDNTQVTENETSDSYDINLFTIPTAPVTVTVTPESPLKVNGQASIELTFTDVTPQTVTVTATDNSVVDRRRIQMISHTASSSDADYNNTSIADVEVTIEDNDAGIIIEHLDDGTLVGENGDTDTYTIHLTTPPTSTVTVNITPDDQSTVSPTSLTFEPNDTALEKQVVTVSAVDDDYVDTTDTTSISHASTSTDSDYGASATFRVEDDFTNILVATVSDNDVAGITFSHPKLTEGGAALSLSVVLNTKPVGTGEVTVTSTVKQSFSSLCNLRDKILTFTTENWNQPQRLYLSADDDDIVEGYDECIITYTASGGDYEGVSKKGSVSIIDDDAEETTDVAEEEGSTETKQLTIEIKGGGYVDVNGKTCDNSSCTLTATSGQDIRLIAYANDDANFVAWQGDAICAEGFFSIQQETHCIAEFEPRRRYLTIESLYGTVNSSPTGIEDCGFLKGTCSSAFEPDVKISLRTTPDLGWQLMGWGGACDETGKVSTLVSDATCNAIYQPIPASADALKVYDYETQELIEHQGLDFDTVIGQPVTHQVVLENTDKQSPLFLTDLAFTEGFSQVSKFPSRLEPQQKFVFELQLDAHAIGIHNGVWSFKIRNKAVGYPLVGVVSNGCPDAATATRIYVKKGVNAGDGGGCNWSTPFSDLQPALLALSNNKYPNVKEVWVATGTYKPTTDLDRTASFRLVEGVKIYGGFLGTEEQRKGRNEHFFECPGPTILSGDIGVANDKSDNSYHVVVAQGIQNAGVYDVTISGGNANAKDRTTRRRTRDGAEIDDSAGGGMYNDGASPTIDNVLFVDNAAVSGGGMFNGAGSEPIITDSAFANNNAENGGGIVNDNSSPAIANVAFTDNAATHSGGGIVNQNNSDPLLNNIVLNNNSAVKGGGMVNNNSAPSITNAYFTGNTADIGGGIVNENGGNAIIDNTLFESNQATTKGGAMLNINSRPAVIQSVISDNTAPTGAGIANETGSKMVIAKSMLEANTDPAGNTTAQVVDDATSRSTVNNSNVEGGWAGAGEGNSDQPFGISKTLRSELPLDEIKATTADVSQFNFARIPAATVPLADNAPAPDTTQSNATDTTQPIIADTTTDSAITDNVTSAPSVSQLIEQPACAANTILYVNARTSGTGCQWQSALHDLQTALTVAGSAAYPQVKEIWVAAGTYKPTTGTDRLASFQLKNNLAIYGGFAGNETQRQQRDLANNVTILSGDIGIIGDQSDNSVHVVTSNQTDPSAILSDVTITSGNANQGNECPTACGGGIFNTASAAQFYNVTLENNAAIYGGGVANNSQSALLMQGLQFVGNTAVWGAGMVNFDSGIQLDNVVFNRNTASDLAGAMFNRNSQITLNHATIVNNSAQTGAGIVNEAGQFTVNNSIFWANRYHLNPQTPMLPIINDWANAVTTATINYSIIEGGWQGAGQSIIAIDPQLINDVYLSEQSPAVDAGISLANLATDIVYNARQLDGNQDGIAAADLGAYEYIFQETYTAENNASLTDKLAQTSQACDPERTNAFLGVCTGHGERVAYTEVQENSSIGNVIIYQPLQNKGLVSNITLVEDGHLQGGRVTGFINNQALITDITFVGVSIHGRNDNGDIVGTLGGRITNESQITSTIEDIRLLAGAEIIGGTVQGRIIGDDDAPAQLSAVMISPRSHLSNVILAADVTIPEKVTLHNVTMNQANVSNVQLAGITQANDMMLTDVTLAEHTQVHGGRLGGTIVGNENAPALLESGQLLAKAQLSHIILGTNLQLGDELKFVKNVWQQISRTIAIGVDQYGAPVIDTQSTFAHAIQTRQPSQLDLPLQVEIGKSLDLLTNLTVDAQHQGQAAEVIVVKQQAGILSILTEDNTWQVWDTAADSLQVTMAIESLPVSMSLQHTLKFDEIGDIQLYMGYRLPSGTIIHNGKAPITLTVVDSL